MNRPHEELGDCGIAGCGADRVTGARYCNGHAFDPYAMTLSQEAEAEAVASARRSGLTREADEIELAEAAAQTRRKAAAELAIDRAQRTVLDGGTTPRTEEAAAPAWATARPGALERTFERLAEPTTSDAAPTEDPPCQECKGRSGFDDAKEYQLPVNNGVDAWPESTWLCTACAYLIADELQEQHWTPAHDEGEVVSPELAPRTGGRQSWKDAAGGGPASETDAERNARIFAMPVELTGEEAWQLACWASNPADERARRDARHVAERVRRTRGARYHGLLDADEPTEEVARCSPRSRAAWSTRSGPSGAPRPRRAGEVRRERRHDDLRWPVELLPRMAEDAASRCPVCDRGQSYCDHAQAVRELQAKAAGWEARARELEVRLSHIREMAAGVSDGVILHFSMDGGALTEASIPEVAPAAGVILEAGDPAGSVLP